jgi:hypothetical protein
MIQELILGDLMKDFGYSLESVLNMGYYEAHRLWLIADEIRFRDIQHFSLALDYSQAQEDFRKEFIDWVKSKQPRRFSESNEIPEEVLNKFAKDFNG